MAVSRRTLITSVAAGSALAAITVEGGAHAASPPGDVVGKITVGYQGWFAAIGDGSPINVWWHWSQNNSQPPSPSNNTIVSWPDMREYTRAYPTAYANLGNGQQATLFSQFDQQTIDTHFRWMQENGCDTAALQRFNPNGDEGPIRDAITVKVRGAAERFGRKFYIMYDVTNWTNMQAETKADWLAKMSAHTASPAYARQNGKPVVCIWGFGFNDPGRPFAPAACLDVVNWFKAQGCYVIGGVPTYWREGINDSRTGFGDVYRAFHMISPWMVGRTHTLSGLDWFYTNVNIPDQAECNARGIDYQPCVMPGDLSSRARAHGDFYWRHFYNMVRVGCQGIYISMFDEYNEGNQIAKTAENAAMTPTNSGLLPLDEDGVACSSDYYLRITADGGKMLKGLLALTPIRPTQPIIGTPPGDTNLAAGKPTSSSSTNGGFAAGNAVDADQGSYWESVNNSFPQWWQVDLGSAAAVSKVVMKLPSHWGSRVQTVQITGSANGSTFTTIVAGTGYTFGPTATVTFPTATVRYLRLNISANTGWPAGQLSQVEVYGTAGEGDVQPPAAPGNLTITGRTTTSISLSWSPSTDNVGVVGYQVRQGGVAIGTTAGTTFTATGLNPGTSYSFTAVATDAAGNQSSSSNTATGSTDPAPNADVARGKPTSASSQTQSYGPGNTVDGDANSYWESVNNAFPQWLQVDLGTATTVGRLVLKLPPPTAWGTRTQTLTVQGSTNGSTFTTLLSSAGHTFNPATGNTVTLTFPAASTRYVRLTFTGNTGWPAGQLSTLEAYAS